jgi:hypothetical protein
MSWRRSRESSDFSSSKGAIIDTNLTQRSDIILESTGFRWRSIRRKRDVTDRFVEPAVGPEAAGRAHIGRRKGEPISPLGEFTIEVDQSGAVIIDTGDAQGDAGAIISTSDDIAVLGVTTKTKGHVTRSRESDAPPGPPGLR